MKQVILLSYVESLADESNLVSPKKGRVIQHIIYNACSGQLSERRIIREEDVCTGVFIPKRAIL